MGDHETSALRTARRGDGDGDVRCLLLAADCRRVVEATVKHHHHHHHQQQQQLERASHPALDHEHHQESCQLTECDAAGGRRRLDLTRSISTRPSSLHTTYIRSFRLDARAHVDATIRSREDFYCCTAARRPRKRRHRQGRLIRESTSNAPP